MVIRGFYDVEREIRPIREGVQEIVRMVARRHNIDAPCHTPEQAMTQGYRAIAAADRNAASEIYDAVKQIPAFLELVSLRRNAELFAHIRLGSVPGLAAGGTGIRIDSPHDTKFRAYWHQEFPAQLRSLDGVVFWSPLLTVTPEMGPVEYCVGSHVEGLIRVVKDDGGTDRTGAYALRLQDEAALVARHPKVAPLTEPGDLILLDFLTLHQSGENVSDRPRWSMQFRYFNFADPVGIEIGWRGSFAAGADFCPLIEPYIGQKN